MNVEILLFARLAEAAGRARVGLTLDAPATVEAALRTLAADHGNLAPLLGSAAVAVNEQYASRSTTLSEGDVLALIPPVSGG